MNCQKHGYYLNINGCPECNFSRALLILRIGRKKEKRA